MTTFDESVGQTTPSSETLTPPSTKTETADTTLNDDTTLSQILTDANIESLEKVVDGVLSEIAPIERSVEKNQSIVLFS